jgi:transcriptional regulator with XRE-family HTH domain
MRSNAEALQAIREGQGHTRPTLAAKSGVSAQRIWDLEQNDIGVRPTTARLLAEALDCEISDITHSDVPAKAEL